MVSQFLLIVTETSQGHHQITNACAYYFAQINYKLKLSGLVISRLGDVIGSRMNYDTRRFNQKMFNEQNSVWSLVDLISETYLIFYYGLIR